jgi:hypothetical protein
MTAETKATPTSDAPALAKPVTPITVHPRAQEALKLLEREYALYRRELPRLLAENEAGRHALVKGDDLTIWDTSGDAIQAGYLRFGLEPFLVQKIDPRDAEMFRLLDEWKESRCQP